MNFFTELKRRNVYKIAIAYAVREKDPALQNLPKVAQTAGCSQLRSAETAALVGPAPRRSALRPNRCLPCTERGR